MNSYEDRLRNIILTVCNEIGCKNCDLKWTEDGKENCSALDLQNKIYEENHKIETMVAECFKP